MPGIMRSPWKFWPAVLIAILLCAQETPPPKPAAPKPPPDEPGVFRLPPRFEPPKEEAPKPEPPKKVVLESNGKPMHIPYTCADEDISAFGMACTEDEPCPIYADLHAVQPIGVKIFLTGNLHNGSNTMYSLLLASEDSGKTWAEAFERIHSAGLEQIQFFDFETGWISGGLLTALPRDPFFLLTTDGGKTWRRRPVFGEPRIGAVEQFWFDSRTSGQMLLDRVQGAEAARYESYASDTGGDGWSIRQVSDKPLQLKGIPPASASAGWRVRADDRTKTHVIERREGTRYLPVASFLIKAGECKPPRTELKEPPSPPEPPTPPAPPPAKPK